VLHWTDEVRGDAAAWVSRPQEMPYYGTPEFKKIKVDMFIRKSFAKTETYDRFAMVVAHEFSHIVLDSINHPLRHEEKAHILLAGSVSTNSNTAGSAISTKANSGKRAEYLCRESYAQNTLL
jgi:predicted SprT family Zn-dependent metalloprotease